MRRAAWAGLLIALCLLASTVAFHRLLTGRRAVTVWDLQPLWEAGRWLLAGRGSPYSAALTERLQRLSYGRPALAGEDPRAFVYPPYVLLLVAPILPLPLAWAQAAWFTVLLTSVFLGVLGTLRLVGWNGSPGRALLAVLWATFLYPVAWALLLGQVALVIFALIVGALWACDRQRLGWAGALLALATAKPQMSFLLAPALLAWVLLGPWRASNPRGARTFLTAFAGTLGALCAASFLAVPAWPVELARAGQGYLEAQPFAPPVVLLGAALPRPWAAAVTGAALLLLAAWLAWLWWRGWASARLPLTAVAATLVVTALTAPRTSIVNQAPLLLGLWLGLEGLARAGWPGKAAAAALWLLLLGGLWALDGWCFPALASAEHARAQQHIISPILPLVTLSLLTLRAARGWRCRPSPA